MKRVGKVELRSINNAGHLLPMDQGEVALNMVNDFVKNAMQIEDEDLNIKSQ